MRGLIMLLAILLAGCAGTATLEELEAEAFRTGDWTAVERRENVLARRAARRGPSCGPGFMAYCESFLGDERCSCLSRDAMVDALAAWR